MLPLDDDFQPGALYPRARDLGRMLSFLYMLVLGPFDVVCGRGKKCYTHDGNIRFRNIVKQWLKKYTSCRVSKVPKWSVSCHRRWHIRRALRYGKEDVCSLSFSNAKRFIPPQTKDEKSYVVMMVVNEIRRGSPYGGFVKKNTSGNWFEVVCTLASCLFAGF